MRFFALEHSRAVYAADFVFYGLVNLGIAVALLGWGPRTERLDFIGLVLLGGVLWTLIEYALHRFALHHVQPFERWHGEHHQRPMAMISSPTYFTAGLFLVLIYGPALALAGPWPAAALMQGVLAGFLAYGITHHAVHHWRARGAWLKRRKQQHALHHHHASGGDYGVTTDLWDRVFGTLITR